MEFVQKKFLVAGTGLSGIGATNLLLRKGASVILYDGNESLDSSKILSQLERTERVSLILGTLREENIKGIEAMIISPGIPCDAPFTKIIRENNIPIWSEIELAFLAGKGTVVGITGTNGKTTTTALVGKIMKDYYNSVFVVGNIGTPYTSVVEDMEDDSVIVAEISSFQLETIQKFKPKISAVLNVTPDHLDRHKTIEAYADVKMGITKNQTKNDICILNYDDAITRAMAEKIPAKPIFFSHTVELKEGIFLLEENIYVRKDDKEELVCNRNELQILGIHNVENVMAAVGMAIWLGVPMESVRKSVKEFQAVEHRIEYVDTIDGIDYYNDSKGTNPDAAIKAIQAMKKPTYLIGGGYDKGASFDEWIQSFDGKVKELVLLGQTAKQIGDTAKKYGFTHIVFVETLSEAVSYCAKHAKEGEAVLLSPACASWGMFKNYEERGCMFKEYVKSLKE